MHHRPQTTDHRLLQNMFYVPCFMVRDTRGQAVIAAVVFFLIISTTVAMGVLNPVLRQMKQSDDFVRTRAALYASHAVNEDALYRLKAGKQFVSPSALSLNGYSAVATATSVSGGLQINSSAAGFDLIRSIETRLSAGSGASFHYGLQAGAGGINLTNSALIVGNVYANGPVTGANSNLVQGTVVSAGPSGIIDGIHATSSAYAHTIRRSDIDGDAYYQSISATSVAGALHPGSPDQATSSLPISDAVIAAWEEEAAAGGVQSSDCSYSGSARVTLGPKKLNCDLVVSNDAVVTLAGPVWVDGDITVSNYADIRISPSLAGKSVPLIADKPSAPTSSGRITLSNFSEFIGAGPNSYLVMVSQNRGAEEGGGASAITVSNDAKGALLLYAAHGLVTLSNGVSLKEVAAYRIQASNSAKVIYETGLADIVFTSGPSGGYELDRWREVE